MMDLLIASAYANSAPAAPAGSGLFQIGMIGFMVVIFYLLIIRPQRKRQKEHDQMITALNIGDEVATNAGILGKVRKVDDHYVILKVAENTELKFQKQAILSLLPKGTLKSIT